MLLLAVWAFLLRVLAISMCPGIVERDCGCAGVCVPAVARSGMCIRDCNNRDCCICRETVQ
jgi:hypothetical protein